MKKRDLGEKNEASKNETPKAGGTPASKMSAHKPYGKGKPQEREEKVDLSFGSLFNQQLKQQLKKGSD